MTGVTHTLDNVHTLDNGQHVTIKGRIVGRSEFLNGYPTYLVETERNGKVEKTWFKAEELHAADGDAK